MLLAMTVVVRRGRRLGLSAVLRRPPTLPDRVLYIDCGLHQEGREVEAMLRWFADKTDLSVVGYEASAWHHAAVEKLFVGQSVELRNEALVGPDHQGDTVRLYKAGFDGRGDSLLAERGSEYEMVPAVRLSEFLSERGEQWVILRMNIEGAEEFVIDDLIDANVTRRVVGYYGMWDDLSKIDLTRDDAFRAKLRAHGIRTITFNDRDLDHRLREWAIRYDIATSLAS